MFDDEVHKHVSFGFIKTSTEEIIAVIRVASIAELGASMLVAFSNSPFPTCVSSSIFLAGPSPRNWDQNNHGGKWRHEALGIFW